MGKDLQRSSEYQVTTTLTITSLPMQAKERREGQNPDYNAEKAPVLTSGYKAVAPTADP